MAKYLQLEGKTGKIYEYSKTPKEGFEEHTSANGNTSYRNYLKTGLYGTLENVSVRESKIGEQIQISVKNNGEYLNLQFPLYTQSGNIDNRYAESFIRFVPVLKKGEGYRFYPYAMEQEDSSYMNYGVSVIKSPNPEGEEKGEKVEPYLTYSKNPSKDTDIPNLTWKEIAGKNKPSAVSLEAKDDFLYTHLKSAVDGHLKYDGGSSSSSNTQESSKPKAEKSTATASAPVDDAEEDYDDLPF